MLRVRIAAAVTAFVGVALVVPSAVGAGPMVKVFFVRGEQFAPVSRAVPPDQRPEVAALRTLLAGPTPTERRAGTDTTLPKGAGLRSVVVRSGVATVDFSFPAAYKATKFDISLRPARAAQVIYTLTALATIRHVVIQINGRVRASFEGTQLALKGPLDRGDFAQPLALPAMPKLVPRGPAPLNLSALQRRLIALRFLPTGTASGKWDYRTQQAVLAFQGWVGETKDGIVGTATRAELELATLPKPTRSRSGSWIEVHRKKGVALLVRDGRVVQAVHVSSGAPGYTTPSGAYRIFRKERNSWSVPYRVWLPYASYFNGGIAFHEWSEIPPQPASHGCVRIPAPEAAAVYAFAANGTAVYVS